MLDWITGSLIYTALKDGFRLFRRKPRRLTPSQIVEKRQKWKDEIEPKLRERRHKGLRSDVIIRDVARLDVYPEVLEKETGISSWFKAGLIGTYHRGILLGLGWERLVHQDGRWRIDDSKIQAHPGKTLILTGYVPYEAIEGISWSGDDYYSCSQIFCHFEQKSKQPYEQVAYCEENLIDYPSTKNLYYYTTIVDFSEVERSSKNRRWLRWIKTYLNR